MDENLLTNQEPIEYNIELSTLNAPVEYKLHWLLRYCYKIQKKLDLAEDELTYFYQEYEDNKKKEYRVNELTKRVSELNRTIKEQHTQINELTLKLLSNNKRK